MHAGSGPVRRGISASKSLKCKATIYKALSVPDFNPVFACYSAVTEFILGFGRYSMV